MPDAPEVTPLRPKMFVVPLRLGLGVVTSLSLATSGCGSGSTGTTNAANGPQPGIDASLDDDGPMSRNDGGQLPWGVDGGHLPTDDGGQLPPEPDPAAPMCGNGQVDQGETCDTAAAADSTGACPTACPTVQPETCVTSVRLARQGTCRATCVSERIAACVDGDECCPAGCEGQDDDCGALNITCRLAIGGAGNESIDAVALDGEGDALVLGTLSGDGPAFSLGGHEVTPELGLSFLAKLSPTCDVRWVRTGTFGRFALDGDDSVYVGDSTASAEAGSDGPWITKLSPAGSVLWQAKPEHEGVRSGYSHRRLEVWDAGGDSVLVGGVMRDGVFSQPYLAALDPGDGSTRWTANLSSSDLVVDGAILEGESLLRAQHYDVPGISGGGWRKFHVEANDGESSLVFDWLNSYSGRSLWLQRSAISGYALAIVGDEAAFMTQIAIGSGARVRRKTFPASHAVPGGGADTPLGDFFVSSHEQQILSSADRVANPNGSALLRRYSGNSELLWERQLSATHPTLSSAVAAADGTVIWAGTFGEASSGPEYFADPAELQLGATRLQAAGLKDGFFIRAIDPVFACESSGDNDTCPCPTGFGRVDGICVDLNACDPDTCSRCAGNYAGGGVGLDVSSGCTYRQGGFTLACSKRYYAHYKATISSVGEWSGSYEAHFASDCESVRLVGEGQDRTLERL